MAPENVIAVFILVFPALIVMSNGAQENLSGEQDLELERQLKMLNKPAVKTIKVIEVLHERTEFGDIFDCVDINKQPAFDNPLLKNHKLQMSPSFFPNTAKQEAPSMAEVMGLPDGGCPQGFVPIRRTRKEELINARMSFNLSNPAMPTTKHNPRSHSTGLQWQGNEKVYGTKFTANVWGLQLDKGEISASSTWVQNECDYVNAGWLVHPAIFGDSQTRIFTHWTTDCYATTGCFNTLCPGFVQIDTQVPLGTVIKPLSEYKGPQFQIRVDVFKDLSSDGNWWLVINGDKSVGYWPAELFSGLADHAKNMHWGGFVNGLPYLPSPPMGSGYDADGGYGRACFTKDIQLMDNFRAFYDPQKEDVYFVAGHPCYPWKGRCDDDGQGCFLYFGGHGCRY
ncbi:hypothetical protein H6P81_017129 [Aristolochia fimbriata]|uniref:Neprosin PEP catalytic domain-containing protein n=1 Tax=Aristolochia fimbriata TaxID=158543 RepID=A0AAV7DX92_ARIFI|nr:hypothetical protein H6P81_017129 [Aristolochia fimbriata]